MTGAAYDSSTVPEWARETITTIAGEHPETLLLYLNWVFEIEAAKRRPGSPPPPPPEDPRDQLHLAAIEA